MKRLGRVEGGPFAPGLKLAPSPWYGAPSGGPWLIRLTPPFQRLERARRGSSVSLVPT